MAEDLQWMVNFYYEQELRSVYMNGIFNSGFKPGIYNADMCIYTNASGQNPTSFGNGSGVYLFIKKGTTLVFSNKYTRDENGRYYSDFNSPGGYIIKTVAYQDISVELITLGSAFSPSVVYFLGNGAASGGLVAPKKFYIMATMTYSSTENVQSPRPVFYLALDRFLDNDQLVVPAPGGDLYSETGDTADYNMYYLMYPTNLEYQIPDGSTSYGGRAADTLDTFSHLVIGEVTNISGQDRAYISTQSGAGDWIDINVNNQLINGATQWVRDHAFIGRGFPGYRQSYLANKNNESPELIPNLFNEATLTQSHSTDPLESLDLSRLYLDARDIFDGDILHTTETDYRFPLGIGNFPNPGESRNILYKLDYDLLENGTYNTTPIDMKTDMVKKGIIPSSGTGTKKVLTSDIIFLSTRMKYSNLPDNDLLNIFNSDQTDNVEIVPFRWYSNCPSDVNFMNPICDNDGDSSSTSTMFDSLNGSKQIVPLDLAESNIRRLLRLVENKNIIPRVIDYIRQHPDESPFISPVDTTTLIPAAIVFRKFDVSYADGAVTEITPVDNASRVPDGTSPGKYNPANILNFFDLQFKTNRLNPIDFKVDNLYSVLPVIN